MKGIKYSNFNNNNYSYAHSVLQSLSCLDCINIFLNNTNTFNLKNNQKFALTNSLYDLFSDLYNGKEGNSENIIFFFNNSYKYNASIIKSDKCLSPDPFYFLYFLLQFLHMENNMPLNNNYNLQNLISQNLQNQKNDDYMYNLFKDFWNQTQNSMITNFFFNIERNVYKCFNCDVYFAYGMKLIFTIKKDIAEYYRNKLNPSRSGTNIDLDDCLKYYCGGCKKNCTFCGNHNIDKYNKFITPAFVLIIAFERDNHLYKGDVNFGINININDYVSKSRGNVNINWNYNLKAIISYRQDGKYVADCYLNNKKHWYRFINDEVRILNDVNEIYKYEPQILIYEYNQQNNINNHYYSNNYNYRNTNYFEFDMNNQNNMNNNNNNLNQINNNNNFDNNQFNQNLINAQNKNANIFQNFFQNAN